MDVVVQKYGGSSVADIDKIRKVAQRIVRTRDAGHRVVAVVSAMGDTTDELLSLAKSMSSSPPARELDMLVTVGERITMALLSMAIQELGHQAVSFTGSQSGIITTASHAGARVMEVRPFRLQDELSRDKCALSRNLCPASQACGQTAARQLLHGLQFLSGHPFVPFMYLMIMEEECKCWMGTLIPQ